MALFDRKASSLNAVKRIDPETEEVLASSNRVCLYAMPPGCSKWERKNVEGPLFLTKRRKHPRFQLMVLNTLSAENYVEPLTGDMEVEVNAPYIMYTFGEGGAGENTIHGMWFSEAGDLQAVLGPLERILAQLPRPGEVGNGADVPAPPPPMPAQQAAPQPVMQPDRHPSPGGGDDGFWDRSVTVTESQLPPTQQLAGFRLGAGELGPSDTGFTHLLRQAQLRAPGTQAPPPAAPVAPLLPAPAPISTTQAAPPLQPAQPLLAPVFIRPAGSAGDEGAVGPANGSVSDNNSLQQLLSRASKQAPDATSLPQLQPGFVGAQGPRSTPQQEQHQQPLPQQVRQAVRQALVRALQNDAVVDALALELQQAGLLKM